MPAHQYRKAERKFFAAIGKVFVSVYSRILGFFAKLIQLGNQRFTVMFIPHSERKIFNFKVSVFALVFIGFIFSAVIVSFFYVSTHFTGVSSLLKDRSENLYQTEASLELLRDEIAELRKSSRIFETALNKALSGLGIQDPQNNQLSGEGDLASFLGMEEQESGTMRELSDLQSLSGFLTESASSLEKVTNLLQSQGDLLVELPTLWPVEGGVGYITNTFGPAEHPFTKVMYLHKGIDIAYSLGKPILATANGKVVERKYQPNGFGKYILVRHNYGFFTKYAHLNTINVREGDEVVQGQQIGTMGSTGLSTGTHLHYEVRIGSQVVDPARFMNITSTLR